MVEGYCVLTIYCWEDMVTVTQDLLEQGISLRGAWNIAQLKALLPAKEFKRRYAWPAKGWKHRLIGSKVTQKQVDEFLALKDRHLGHKKRDLPEQMTFEREMYSHIDSIKVELRNSKLNKV